MIGKIRLPNGFKAVRAAWHKVWARICEKQGGHTIYRLHRCRHLLSDSLLALHEGSSLAPSVCKSLRRISERIFGYPKLFVQHQMLYQVFDAENMLSNKILICSRVEW